VAAGGAEEPPSDEEEGEEEAARQDPAYEGPPRRRSSSRLASAESAFAYLSGAAIRPVTSTRTGPAHQRVSRPRVLAFLAHAQLLTAASTKRDGQRDHVNDPLGRPQLATCYCQQGHRGHPGSMPAAGPPERPCLPWPETERLSRSSDAESLVAPARPVRHLPGRAGLTRGQGAADGLVDLAGAQEQLAAGAGCGALGPGRAGPAGGGGEPDHDLLPFPCWTWLQPVLVASWGQVTCWWSQSMVNISAVYPPERACGGLADSSGPSRVMPRARASSSSSAKVYPESTTCSPGGQPGSLQHVVDGLGHRRAGHGRLGGGDAGDQVRGLAGAVGLRLLAGLADVDPIARPALAALLGVAGIRVIGETSLSLPGGTPCLLASRRITFSPCSSVLR
jgi:hypothetical protein